MPVFCFAGSDVESTRTGGAYSVCLLRNRDGVVRHLFCNCGQPRVADRRPLRVCRSCVWPLRRFLAGVLYGITALGAVAGVVNRSGKFNCYSLRRS